MPAGDRRPPLPGPLGRLASRLYALAIDRVNRRYDAGAGVIRFDRPVISVGNLSVGGTGKTPLVRHITRLLLAAGHRPCIAMRGYRAGPSGSDEAAAYQREFPSVPIVAQANRADGLMDLFSSQHDADGPHSDCIILDDGFQHRRIARDLDIVLIDASRSPFDDRLLPAGYLREPVASLARADFIVLTHAESAPDLSALTSQLAPIAAPDAITRHTWSSLSILEHGAESSRPPSWLRARPTFVACAIGNPAPFLAAAEAASGQPLAGSLILRDHDPFSPATVRHLIDQARRAGAQAILITDKDWSKLRTVAPHQWPCPIARPALELTFDQGEQQLTEALVRTLQAGAPA